MMWQWCSFDQLNVHELYAALALRAEVFVVEQTCAYQDPDGLDAQAMHLLGWQDGALVAYLRAFPAGAVYPELCIGRVVTSPAARGRGLGDAAMREGMRRCAQQWGPGPIKISAQSHLERWYTSLGFAVCGPGYLEDDIPHLPMRRPLSG